LPAAGFNEAGSLTVTGNGTASVTLSGTLTNLNSDLPSLTYTPTK
jgi:hypothetical protein